MTDAEGNPITPISHLGEFGLIAKLTEPFALQHASVLKGVGDDCAVIEKDTENVWLITTDLMAEGVHFDLMYAPLRHVGYKAAVTNFSDVVAMNGKPLFITVSVALPVRFSVEAAEQIYAGIHAACDRYKVDLIGGDTTRSQGGLFISITCMGEAPKSDVVYRSGAKEKELICVSGDLGAAYAGLQILEREKKVFSENPNVQPDLHSYEYVVGRQLKPEPRTDVLEGLRKAGIHPTSMIDVSDGLASDLQHLCAASALGARLFWDKIPHDYQVDQVAELMNTPVSAYVLYGGEDYELLFTIAQKDADKLKLVPDCKMIGYMDAATSGINLALPEDTLQELKPLGFDHFRA
jgi:thiamine-monophosphate kinase